MAKLLVIKASPNPVEASFGLTTAKSFVEAYKAANPGDEVTEINVFDQFIPEVDGNLLAAYGELAGGKSFDQLSESQQKQVSATESLRNQFMDHDKFVFVTPLWNFSFPARLKSYLDALMAAGITFKYTESGPVGLLEGKKALHIEAAGSVYKSGTLGDSLLRASMAFIGINDYQTLSIQGQAFTPDKADEIKAKAAADAAEIAKTF